MLWYPASAPAAAAAAAAAGKPASSGSAGNQQPAAAGDSADSQHQLQQAPQDSLAGLPDEAFAQPADSMMHGGDSFISAASRLRWSSGSADMPAPSRDGAAGHSAADVTAADPDAAESADDGDYGRLELECTDVVIDAAGGSASGGVTAAARLYALSTLEYLSAEDARCGHMCYCCYIAVVCSSCLVCNTKEAANGRFRSTALLGSNLQVFPMRTRVTMTICIHTHCSYDLLMART